MVTTMKRRLGILALALTAAGSMYADNVAYVTTLTNQFGTIDLDTGVYTQIKANIGVQGNGLGVAGGYLFTANYNGSNLYRINATNGNAVKVGNSSIVYEALGSTLKGLYALDQSFNLYTVNPRTAVVTLIGPTGIPPGDISGVGGISTNSTALYYAGDQILYVIDTCTGAATEVGTLTMGNGLTAMVYEGGTLYGYSYGSSGSVIYNVGLTTAVETVVSTVSGSPAPAEIVGFAPSVLADFAPTRLDFGPQTASASSPAQQVTITNRGIDPMTISEIRASGDFSQTNTCGSVLPTERSCTVTVTFTPTRSGIRAGMLTIADGSSSRPRSLTLTGAGM